MKVTQIVFFICLAVTSYSCKSQSIPENQKLTKISDSVFKLEEYYENGKLQTEIYVDKEALPHGRTIIYDSLGRKKSEFNYTHGKKNGKQLSYFVDGKIESEDFFLNDVQEGDDILMDKNGNILFHQVYRNGKVRYKYYIKDQALFKSNVALFMQQGKDSLEAVKLAEDYAKNDSLKTIEFNNANRW